MIMHGEAGRPYRVLGYRANRFSDSIHSFDLVEAFVGSHSRAARSGSAASSVAAGIGNCSMLRSDRPYVKEISGRKLTWSCEETNRIGDHIWWISDVKKIPETLSRLEISLRTCQKSWKKSIDAISARQVSVGHGCRGSQSAAQTHARVK